MHVSVMQRSTVPSSGCKDPALVTGHRDPGEPLGRPVKCSPPRCQRRGGGGFGNKW